MTNFTNLANQQKCEWKKIKKF